MMGKPTPTNWTPKKHPWVVEIQNFNGDWVAQKAAQMALTTTALIRVLFVLDVKKLDCAYFLPKWKPDAVDFSASRFDEIYEYSPHVKSMFSVNNTGHKRAGIANLYIRGAQSESGMKSIPAAEIILDELDEMPGHAVSLAEQRASGQEAQNIQIIMLSTPTIPKFGINLEFENTTQDHYYFKCPCCSRFTEFIYPDCLVITADEITDPKLYDSHYICKECKKPLRQEEKIDFLDYRKCEWAPTFKDRPKRGFYINQLYSILRPASSLAKLTLEARYNQFKEKELFRSGIGVPFIPEGARVSEEMILNCKKEHTRDQISPAQSLITMGVDQGKWIHYEIDQWFLPNGVGPDVNSRAICKNITHGKVPNFEDLDKLMRTYQVLMCVIDAHPEKRKAFEFANRFYGHIYLCFYNRGLSGKQLNISKENLTVGVDRTSWLDVSLGRFFNKSIMLPRDTIPEYTKHIQGLVKETNPDETGNLVSKYIAVDEDHFAHARNYSEIALPLALTIASEHKDIGRIL
jgi:hypothetical protein